MTSSSDNTLDTSAIPMIEIYAVKYRVGNEQSQTFIEARGNNLWAVTQGNDCLASDGEWELEPMPSSQTTEFLKRCRFSFEDAKQRAIDIVRSEMKS